MFHFLGGDHVVVDEAFAGEIIAALEAAQRPQVLGTEFSDVVLLKPRKTRGPDRPKPAVVTLVDQERPDISEAVRDRLKRDRPTRRVRGRIVDRFDRFGEKALQGIAPRMDAATRSWQSA